MTVNCSSRPHHHLLNSVQAWLFNQVVLLSTCSRSADILLAGGGSETIYRPPWASHIHSIYFFPSLVHQQFSNNRSIKAVRFRTNLSRKSVLKWFEWLSKLKEMWIFQKRRHRKYSGLDIPSVLLTAHSLYHVQDIWKSALCCNLLK